jgi:hypothetical protein
MRYVDDLLIAVKDSDTVIKALQEDHKFKIKGFGSLAYHLGRDYFHVS